MIHDVRLELGRSVVLMLLFFFFFFQAEDGIRDYKVTGVQTCALPISPRAAPPYWWRSRGVACSSRSAADRWTGASCRARATSPRPRGGRCIPEREIGRASCRERV